MKIREIPLPLLASVMIVFLIDMFTNNLDIEKYRWDFLHYINIAEHGFEAKPLAAPFVYRYPTPFIASGIRNLFGFSIYIGFKVVAYIGATLQLGGVFFFVRWLTGSKKSSFVAMLVTAFSLCNVKFLLFDVFRPDHLAYPFILLQSYFCFRRMFGPLLLASVIGIQFREFAIIPLIAYLMSFILTKNRLSFRIHLIPAILCIILAVVVPRMLIPITENWQYVDLSASGIKRMFLVPLDFKRDINLAFSIIAYILPSIMLLSVDRIKYISSQVNLEIKSFLLFYSGLVVLLSLYGGTDLARFATYLFMPQAILVGLLARIALKQEIIIMCLSVFTFNRIWAHIPIWDFNKYLDFFHVYHSRITLGTALSFGECMIFCVLGFVLRRIRNQKRSSGLM